MKNVLPIVSFLAAAAFAQSEARAQLVQSSGSAGGTVAASEMANADSTPLFADSSKYVSLKSTPMEKVMVVLDSVSSFLSVDLGTVQLQPNTAGQVVDFYVQNTGSGAQSSILGLNFAMEVGNGSSGPVMSSVNLHAGNSIFSSYGANQTDQGSSPQLAFYQIDNGGAGGSLPAGSSTLLAEVTFDTTGLSSGSWSLKANNITVNSFNLSTQYTLTDSSTRAIDSFTGGTLTIVPEPAAYGLASGLLLVGIAAQRKLRGYSRS